MYCSFDFFSFRITRTSVNTDVLGRSSEVCVNEVLLYPSNLYTVKFPLPEKKAIYTLFSYKLHAVYKITCYVYGPEIKLQTFFSSQRPAMPYPLTRARGVNPYLLHAASFAKITDPAPSQMP